MHFLEWECLNSYQNITAGCSLVSNYYNSSIGSDDGLAPTRRQVIIWINDGKFTDAYMRHSTSMIWYDEIYVKKYGPFTQMHLLLSDANCNTIFLYKRGLVPKETPFTTGYLFISSGTVRALCLNFLMYETFLVSFYCSKHSCQVTPRFNSTIFFYFESRKLRMIGSSKATNDKMDINGHALSNEYLAAFKFNHAEQISK